MDPGMREELVFLEAAPDTRRRRRLRELLPQERPAFLEEREWRAAVRWARDRLPLDVVAAEHGMSRWPLKRTLERVLGRLERAERDGLAALPRRQAYLLGLVGVRTAEDLARASDAQLLAVPGIGPTALARLRRLAAVSPTVPQRQTA